MEYTDDNIRHLSDMEHVRTRPGMYIGRLGDGNLPEDGIYVLLKEVVDNSIDEFKMGAGARLEIDIEDHLRVSVRDYGRGIPQGKLVEAVSVLNTGGKHYHLTLAPSSVSLRLVLLTGSCTTTGLLHVRLSFLDLNYIQNLLLIHRNLHL